MIRVLLLLIGIIIGLSSCDVPGRLDIVNKTDRTATYSYYLTNEAGVVDTFHIEVEGKNKSSILFGFGWRWTDEQISEYSKQLKKVELISGNDTLTLNSQSEIYDYFSDHRSGLLKKRVRIIFK